MINLWERGYTILGFIIFYCTSYSKICLGVLFQSPLTPLTPLCKSITWVENPRVAAQIFSKTIGDTSITTCERTAYDFRKTVFFFWEIKLIPVFLLQTIKSFTIMVLFKVFLPFAGIFEYFRWFFTF